MPEIEIHWDRLEEVSEAQRAEAEARLSALATQHDDLLSLRVARPPQRSDSPPHPGLVDRVLVGEGYGFIVTDDGRSVYFHRNAVSGGLAFERLEEGQRIRLNLEPGEEGLQATVVLPAPPDTPSP